MRALALLALVLAGCLSAPTGVDQSWPPPGLAVGAFATGDLDGDTFDDVVVVDVGPTPTLYLIFGATELTSAGFPLRYSTKVGLDVTPPVRAVVIDQRVVVLDSPATGARFRVFDAATSLRGEGALDSAAGTHVMFAHASGFGMDGSVLFGTDSAIRFLEHAELDAAEPMAREIMAPAGDFQMPQAAEIAIDAGGSVALVSETMRTRRGIGTGTPPTFTWTDVRTTGDWPAQISTMLDGDALPDVIGLATDRTVCVALGSITTTAQPACSAPLGNGAPPSAVLFGELGGPVGRELVIARGADLIALTNLRVDGAAPGTVVSDGMRMVTTSGTIVAAAIWRSTGSMGVLTTSAGGLVDCTEFNGGNFVRCTGPFVDDE